MNYYLLRQMILFILVKPNIRSQIILRLDITAELVSK